MNWNPIKKGLVLGLSFVFLLLGNGCGETSEPPETGTITTMDTQEDALTYPSYWHGWFSEESPTEYCQDGYLIGAMRFTGRYSDNLDMLCVFKGHHSLVVEQLSQFSEEGQNWRICSGNNFVTQIKCKGSYCDNLNLGCSQMENIRKGNCYWTDFYSDNDTVYLGAGYYVAGIKCTGSYCDNMSLYACKAIEYYPVPISNCYRGMCPTYYNYYVKPDGSIGSNPAPDSDGDGIPDNVETYLLEKYSPYFLFSQESGNRWEHFNPTDPWWYFTKSTVLAPGSMSTFPYWGLIPVGSLASDPMKLIGPGAPTGNAMGYNLFFDSQRTKACLDQGSADGDVCPVTDANGNSIAYGDPTLDWTTIKSLGNVGLFGHVVPDANPNIYKIEYWQFFAWNDGDQALCYTNHQADWCSIQLRYDSSINKIVSVHHYVHGHEIPFTLEESTLRTLNTLVTFTLTDVFQIIFDNYIEYWGENHGVSFNNANIIGAVTNNTLRMFQDPWTGEFNHPMVYIEYGSHEFWPTEEGAFCMDIFVGHKCSTKHGGDAYRFLTHSIPNLGEVESASYSTNEAEVILKYNGDWGCRGHNNNPPPGPPLHKSWTWPAKSTLKPKIPPSSFE
jgi:hypothetical protein